jgi:hypothetical protein
LPLIAPPTDSDFPTLPELEPITVTIDSIRRVPNTKFPAKDGTIKDQFEIVLVPTDPELADARIWYYAGVSWHEKSKLVPLAQACFDHQLSLEELYAIDPEKDLLDKELVVIGQYPSEDSQYLKVSTLRRSGAAAAPRRGRRPAATPDASVTPVPAAAGAVDTDF